MHRVVLCISLVVGLLVTASASAVAPPKGDPYNTFPIAEAQKKFSVDLKEEAAAKAPVFKIVGKRRLSEEVHEPVFEIILVNPLDVEISYGGYTMDAWEERPKPGEISPLYATEVKTAADPKWHDGGPGWCGTGAGEMVIRPHEAGRFTVRIEPESVALKAGVACEWKNAAGEKVKQTLWTPDLLAEKK